MGTLLLYGDTARSAALRHEVPLEIIDPFLFVEHEGRPHVLTNVLERDRIAAALPYAELALADELGIFELILGGMRRHDAELEIVVRALDRWGVRAASVPPDLPVAIADRVRAHGIALTVDVPGFERRRRAKTAVELEGVRSAQRAAEAGMRAGEDLIRAAERVDGGLVLDGAPLTAEQVRAAIRDACAEHGAPAPPDILVTSAWSGGGHDPGAGPLPADLPITIDLWPRDEQTGCWADMTRTFVSGTVPAEVAAARELVLEALQAGIAACRPGVTGRAVYDAAADVIERGGHPTQRTRDGGASLTHGFYFSLGHGVGLEVHEAPGLGLSGHDELVPGDVLALEPGLEGMPYGGVRFEDLVLVTDDGAEVLTDYPYAL